MRKMWCSRYVLASANLRSLFRQCSTNVMSARIVKVFCSEEDNMVKVNLNISGNKTNKLRALKEEKVHKVLDVIKQLFVVHDSFNSYLSNNKSSDSVDVCLMHNGVLLDSNVPNSDAWLKASVLKVGDIEYEVSYNLPKVKEIILPECIVSGCPIRVRFELECASETDSVFVWYRSLTNGDGKRMYLEDNNNVIEYNGGFWLKIHKGTVYSTSSEDIGHYLKVVCTPKLGDRIGNDLVFISPNVVEPAHDRYPFEDRQEITKTVCDEKSIRCVSYNVLANSYADAEKFPYASSKALNRHYRKQILLRELLGYNGDILCLQEVQEWAFLYDIEPILSQMGYSGVYKRKGGVRIEGLATFVRSSKFRITKRYDIILKNSLSNHKDVYTHLFKTMIQNTTNVSKLCSQDTALQLTLLEHLDNPERKLLVANTHLYSNKDMPDVRLFQAVLATHYIEHIIKKENLQSAGIIFCGDFNSLPDSLAYEYLTSGQCLFNTNNSESILRHSMSLESACGTPEYTNYTQEFTGCLDYIFYHKDCLEVTEVVPMPEQKDVSAQGALPSEYFPSDHIALVCTLQWKS